MEIDSPVEITEEEAIDTIEELWSRLFSVETQIDTDDFYTDRGIKRTSEDPNDGNPAKSSWNGKAGNSDPLPLGYSRGPVMNVSRSCLREDINMVKRRKRSVIGASCGI